MCCLVLDLCRWQPAVPNSWSGCVLNPRWFLYLAPPVSFFFLLGPRMALTSPVTVRGPSWSSADCRSVKLRFGFHVHRGLQSQICSSTLEIIVGWTCICTASCILTQHFYCVWVQESAWMFLFSIICSVCGSHGPAGIIRNVSVPCVSSSLACVSGNDFLLNLQSVQTACYPL